MRKKVHLQPVEDLQSVVPALFYFERQLEDNLLQIAERFRMLDIAANQRLFVH